MFVAPLIERKRDGGTLSAREWRDLVRAYAGGDVPDYQMSALLMAVMFRGLDATELEALLDAMLESGGRLVFEGEVAPRVDKHSTGGVGDNVSLVLAPAAAASGVMVPMMSGRGLGHTGGTLDKLESIPGFRTALTLDQVQRQVERLGCAMFGQTPEIAPADRKLYALRDATGTVPAIPLIAASILSKKLAEDLDGLVLDVKRGSGAQFRDLDRTLELADTMVRLSESRGCRAVALVTAMDQPLGRACGNALEVREAIAVMQGEGPEDLRELVIAEGAEMLLMCSPTNNAKDARDRVIASLDSGAALERFVQMVDAQGGDTGVVEDPDRLPVATVVAPCRATHAGVVQQVDTRAIGLLVNGLGGGRQTMDDSVDPGVGVVMHARVGDAVVEGQSLADVYGRTTSQTDAGCEALSSAIQIGESPMAPLPLISHRVTRAGTEELA